MNKEDNNTRELDLSNGNWIKIELDQVVIIMFLGYKFGHIIQNNWINTVAVFFFVALSKQILFTTILTSYQ